MAEYVNGRSTKMIMLRFSNLQMSVILAKEWNVGSWETECFKVGNRMLHSDWIHFRKQLVCIS